jgi:hypothetical protein
MATVLTFGHATDNTAGISQVQLAAAVIGVGGRGDSASANIPAKINHSLVPAGCDCYVPVPYPAGFLIDRSVTAGVPVLDTKLQAAAATDPEVLVVGYSEGALVAEREKRSLAASPGNATPDKVSFAMIASANLPNGGIFARFPKVNLIFVSSNGPAQPTTYDTTYYTNEYDTYADFPAYFNLFSLANSLAAVWFVHPDPYYDTIDLTAEPAGPAFTKTVDNSAGGTDTYVFVLADHLPLFAPIRELSAALGTTAFTEPILSAIEPFVRVLVDMGYTDRENLDPEVPTKFRFFTPLSKITEAFAQTPGALTQGAANFEEQVTPATRSMPVTPAAPTLAPDNATSPAPKDTSTPKSQSPKQTFSPLAAKDPLFGKGKLKLLTTPHHSRTPGADISKADDAVPSSQDSAPTGETGKNDAAVSTRGDKKAS